MTEEKRNEIHKAILNVRDLIREAYPDDDKEDLVTFITITDGCLFGATRLEVNMNHYTDEISTMCFEDTDYFNKEDK